MNIFTRLLVFMGLLILWGMAPSNAHACNYNLYFTGPASISVNPSISVGGVLWSGSVKSPATSDLTQCVSGTFDLVTEGTTSYLGNNLYATSIPGVAARMKMATNCATGEWFPSTCRLGLPPTFYWPAQTMVVEFVKTGSVGGGSLSGVFGRWRITSSYPQVYTTLSWGAPIQVVLITPTCSVNANSTQTVNLGDYRTTDFSGVGSMTPAKAFNINFNCSGGTAGGTSNIYITMTDATVPANRTSNLNLTTTSTAGGVAVRIRRNGGATDVLYGADSATIGNANQWQAGTVATGTPTFSVPLQASMIQTGTVTTGSVSAKATFTVAYN